MGSSVHVNNKQKYVIILGKSATQGLDDTRLSTEKKVFNQFYKSSNKFCFSLHYNGADSYIFVNVLAIHKYKAKVSKINAISSCIGKISKYLSVGNVKRTGFNIYVYDVSVDYQAIAVDDILDIHKHLMENNEME